MTLRIITPGKLQTGQQGGRQRRERAPRSCAKRRAMWKWCPFLL